MPTTNPRRASPAAAPAAPCPRPCNRIPKPRIPYAPNPTSVRAEYPTFDTPFPLIALYAFAAPTGGGFCAWGISEELP